VEGVVMGIAHLKSRHGGPYPYKSKETAAVALRAIIFDCDGVLVDSEPLHFAAFRKTLGPEGERLTEELYKERYLALDDRGAFTKFYQEAGRPLDVVTLKNLIDKKAEVFQELVGSEGILPYPAVPEFVMALAQRYPLAIASGARRHELEMIAETAGIRPYFEAIISADDVEKGKPDPESYLKAIDALNATGKRATPIKADECVVIEDSKQGIASAHGAGMKCVAVATSYPSFELSAADLVVPSISALRISQIEDLFHHPMPLPLPQTSPQNN
jgi:beta-phosphoglucomutase